MKRDQVTGLGRRFDDEVWSAVSWGLGRHILGDPRPRQRATLKSPRTIDAQGYPGAHLSVDPEAGMVVVVHSLLREVYPTWSSDLQANPVLAAIEA
jgi:CubicO group peptidase (beta-lactamase class C family)